MRFDLEKQRVTSAVEMKIAEEWSSTSILKFCAGSVIPADQAFRMEGL